MGVQSGVQGRQEGRGVGALAVDEREQRVEDGGVGLGWASMRVVVGRAQYEGTGAT